jgi:hypothetical protein
MSAFIAGTPVAAKVAAKPVARRDATVRAAANSECVPGAATIGMTNTRDVDVIAFSRPTSADAPRPLPPSPPPPLAHQRPQPPRRRRRRPRALRRRAGASPRPLARVVGAIVAIPESYPRRFAARLPKNNAVLSISTRRDAPPDGRVTPTHPARSPRLPFDPPRAPSDSKANAETKHVRVKASTGPPTAFTAGKVKAPRAFLKDKQAEVLAAYGLESLPGQ